MLVYHAMKREREREMVQEIDGQTDVCEGMIEGGVVCYIKMMRVDMLCYLSETVCWLMRAPSLCKPPYKMSLHVNV